ncbi:peptidoglycan-binding protein LysM [Pseudomonas syringae]|nr:peptidoglycan-binding protein LysM [Pseudomonas syringae]MCF5066693.1 peptidoglycan-binding protein LysM [Pseudomonas syringae]
MLESRRMVWRGCTKGLLVGGLITWSTWALALGLGDITVHSALNQPFKADIALVDVANLSESDLSVSLATADEFGQAGIERVFFLNDLKFTPILRGNRHVIRVTSAKAVSEPFLNFLVQLSQPNGRLLREYTVLIDPPGSPNIVPATDEPAPRAQSSEFPTVEPAVAAPPANPAPATPKPAAAPVNDALAEQLAASVLQNRQLQKKVDELNAKLSTQEAQIADGKKQVSDLQTRLAEIQQAPPAPSVPAPVMPAPAQVTDDSLNWPLLGGLLAMVGMLLAVVYVRRRKQAHAFDEPLPPTFEKVPEMDEVEAVEPVVIHETTEHRYEPAAGDVLEAVAIYLAYGRLGEAVGLLREALVKEPQRTDLGLQLLDVLGRQGDNPGYIAQENHLRDTGVDGEQLQDIRARHPKLAGSSYSSALPVAPLIVAPPVESSPPVQAVADDDFELNLDDLSMDSSWDLEDSRPAVEPPAHAKALGSSLEVLPQDFELPDGAPPEDGDELEWIADTDPQPLDDDFLNEFGDTPTSLTLAPLDPMEIASVEKLEQAQTCIDDGDLDNAIALLNELLAEGDEPLKHTARTLLAGIR